MAAGNRVTSLRTEGARPPAFAFLSEGYETTNNREFVLVMKDRGTSAATPNEPPKLTVRYCP